MASFEYRSFSVDPAERDKDDEGGNPNLNALGEEGWELVNVWEDRDIRTHYVFKREVMNRGTNQTAPTQSNKGKDK